ncbi:MAG: Ig-like domain-containing protein [Sulfuritalea sp.]|nr:Ig-like domain-containing protein [Sulfuritalea sp.]MDP1981191.1 Ig-like domain-containing protein [Sulfuritalea sp.]
MVIADQPNIPEASPSVVLMASTNPEQQASGQTERIMGECWLVKADGYGQGFSPIITANLWFNVNPEKIESETAEIRILRQPKHGTLEILNPIWAGVNYRPDKGYRGNDTAVLKVKGNGYTVKIHYFFRVVKESGARIYDNKNCIGPVWKISSDSPQTPIDLSSLQRDVVLSALLADASHALAGFADVPGDAIGQTTGEGKGATITLDTNAAGYNWFIDYTPSDNSEFLPTANPNEWIAKASSEAAGKMDMLSVLLHEYGHALGFEHSANSQDFMATTLTPGVRRLPSAEELALMAQLVGEVKGDMADASSNTPDTPQSPLPSLPLGGAFGLALLGRLRSTRYGGWNIAVESATQYEIAANPKLSNTEFAGGQGWSTTGDVRFQDGAATLTEAAASQTRLNQVFIVGENDRFLSFTVADTALDDADQAPDDAFEVALLDANTGASLLGGTGLTRNDAFLNLQANGNEHKSQAVTSIRNADGSRTYLVDLAGIPAGTAVNLAFDLIGFGKGAAATSSHLTIRDLRIGVPQTKDDSATLAEDGVTTIAALANDLNAQQPGFAPVIVDAPAHGQVTINADGSFSFAPEQNWNGEDRFTYKLSDGRVDSNLATVSLTVTPVNDAPVTVADAASVGEDGTLAASGNLLANDSDADAPQEVPLGDAATVLTVAAPGEYVGAYGTLTLAQDGSYSYTLANDSSVVQALRAGEVVTDVFAYAASDGLTSTPAQLTVTITGQNDAPVTAADAANVQEDGTLAASGNLLANDSDVDAPQEVPLGDTDTILTVSAPGDYVGAYGTLNLGLDGSYSYTLTNDSAIVQALREGEIVSDVFTYAASDGITITPAQLTVTITGSNDAPITTDDAASVSEDGSLAASGNLLENDTDVDTGTVLTVVAPNQRGSN